MIGIGFFIDAYYFQNSQHKGVCNYIADFVKCSNVIKLVIQKNSKIEIKKVFMLIDYAWNMRNP